MKSMPVLLAISAVLVSVISVQCKPSRNTEYYYDESNESEQPRHFFKPQEEQEVNVYVHHNRKHDKEAAPIDSIPKEVLQHPFFTSGNKYDKPRTIYVLQPIYLPSKPCSSRPKESHDRNSAEEEHFSHWPSTTFSQKRPSLSAHLISKKPKPTVDQRRSQYQPSSIEASGESNENEWYDNEPVQQRTEVEGWKSHLQKRVAVDDRVTHYYYQIPVPKIITITPSKCQGGTGGGTCSTQAPIVNSPRPIE